MIYIYRSIYSYIYIHVNLCKYTHLSMYKSACVILTNIDFVLAHTEGH